MNRRDFLFNAAIASGGAALMFGGFLRRADIFAETGNFESLRAAGYGELAPVAAKNTGECFSLCRRVLSIKFSAKSAT
ncbi:MAG: hypothetical protein M3367_06820 [Acidobacteriota bacterium]|nr:hypothetical protein [Acidobacteriota bacterium]